MCALKRPMHGLLPLLTTGLSILSLTVNFAQAAPGDTQHISLGDAPTISSNGRFVGFRWDGYDPTFRGTQHIYLHDRWTGQAKRISTEATFWESDEAYWGNNVALSANGRIVAYMSKKYGYFDVEYGVHLYDQQTGSTQSIVSFVGPTYYESFVPSTYQVSLTGDGRYVAFDALRSGIVADDTNRNSDVFVYDRLMPWATSRASVGSSGQEGNGRSDYATITPDGRYVAFWSDASNLVPGDSNGVGDVFVRDRQTGITERVSLSATGQQANAGIHDFTRSRPALSDDGRYVAFLSDASNLVEGDTNQSTDVFVRDRLARTTERIDMGTLGCLTAQGLCGVSMNANGRYVAFVTRSGLVQGDNNRSYDVYVHDRTTGGLEIASVQSNGLQLPMGVQPSLSADGRFVALRADGGRDYAFNRRVYVHELGGTSIYGYRVIGNGEFGPQTMGTNSTARYFTVENRGSIALNIQRIELRGSGASDFTILSRCGSTLAVGAKCNVKVTFTPRSLGLKTARLAAVFALRVGSGFFTKDLTGASVAASRQGESL